MRFKILSLMLIIGAMHFCGNVQAQITPPPACTSIISDIAQLPPNTSQAATDAMTCVTNIAGVVAAPLCQAGCPNGVTDCTSPCQPLCTTTYGAHNVACCLEALVTAKPSPIPIPTDVSTVLDTICGAFASTVTIPVIDKQWCYAIPNATAQQALPYIGTICCNYYSSTNNSTGVTNTDTCLGTTTPALACAQYDPSKICTPPPGSTAQAKKEEKDKK